MHASTYAIVVDADVYGARNMVRSFAATMGFGRVAQAELVIVASELASNILKYGTRGSIRVQVVHDDAGRSGIEIAAKDIGPPIRDFDMALRDGWTDGERIDPMLLLRRRGLGAGLGAVLRLSDRLSYHREEEGKTIIAQRFLRRLSSLPPHRR